MNLTSSHIARQEQKTRIRYLSAVQHFGNTPLPVWFNDYLEHSVPPMLIRVGFDREIAGSIFKISAPAWKSMGPVTDPKLRLHLDNLDFTQGRMACMVQDFSRSLH